MLSATLSGCLGGPDDTSEWLEYLGHEVTRLDIDEFELSVTVENIAEEEIEAVGIFIDVYEDDTRLGEFRTRMLDLPAGIRETASTKVFGFEAEDVTHYTIEIGASVPGGTTEPIEFAYDGDAFRERVHAERG